MPGSTPSTVDTTLTADENLALRGQHSVREDNISTHLLGLTTLEPIPFLFSYATELFHPSALGSSQDYLNLTVISQKASFPALLISSACTSFLYNLWVHFFFCKMVYSKDWMRIYTKAFRTVFRIVNCYHYYRNFVRFIWNFFLKEKGTVEKKHINHTLGHFNHLNLGINLTL